MPFHWCMDETMMVMAMIPFIGAFFRRIHVWYHVKFNHSCHKDNCQDKHLDHK